MKGNEPSVVDLEKKYLGSNLLERDDPMYRPPRATAADNIVSELFANLAEYEKASTSLNFVDRLQGIIEKKLGDKDKLIAGLCLSNKESELKMKEDLI